VTISEFKTTEYAEGLDNDNYFALKLLTIGLLTLVDTYLQYEVKTQSINAQYHGIFKPISYVSYSKVTCPILLFLMASF